MLGGIIIFACMAELAFVACLIFSFQKQVEGSYILWRNDEDWTWEDDGM